MSRPRKWKKVCCLPENTVFGSLNAGDDNRNVILMTVEEYETLRLIDLEGLTQEECSKRMSIARSTVQKLYVEARSKTADALVNGSLLKIEGGNYQLYDNREIAECAGCHRMRCGHKR